MFWCLLTLLVCTCAGMPVWQALESQHPLASPEGDLRGFQGSWAKSGLAGCTSAELVYFLPGFLEWGGQPRKPGNPCLLHCRPQPSLATLPEASPMLFVSSKLHTMPSFRFLPPPGRESNESRLSGATTAKPKALSEQKFCLHFPS